MDVSRNRYQRRAQRTAQRAGERARLIRLEADLRAKLNPTQESNMKDLTAYSDAELKRELERLDSILARKQHRPAHITYQREDVLDEIERRKAVALAAQNLRESLSIG